MRDKLAELLECSPHLDTLYHEPWEYEKADKIIDDTTERFREYIFDTDKKIQEQFEQIKKKLGVSDNERKS